MVRNQTGKDINKSVAADVQHTGPVVADRDHQLAVRSFPPFRIQCTPPRLPLFRVRPCFIRLQGHSVASSALDPTCNGSGSVGGRVSSILDNISYALSGRN